MKSAKRILLKTTIPLTEDDWHIGRFSILKRRLEKGGHEVIAADRRELGGDDSDLASLEDDQIDQLWLFAVDIVGALSEADAMAVDAFRRRGGGLMLTRDHQDMGDCVLKLGLPGYAHNFQARNPESDSSRHQIDDMETSYVSWPNYHSGANGDFQRVTAPDPDHPLVRRHDGTVIEHLPAHPHEGVVSVPTGAQDFASLVLVGSSKVSGRSFGCAVAIEGEPSMDGAPLGRAVAQSTFHHFVDPNLDPGAPLPSFVTEKSGSGMRTNVAALQDSLQYIDNLAEWLSA